MRFREHTWIEDHDDSAVGTSKAACLGRTAQIPCPPLKTTLNLLIWLLGR